MQMAYIPSLSLNTDPHMFPDMGVQEQERTCSEMGMQSQSMNLVLSTDAKPRLKWTPELHHRFVDAVSQMGAADKATPKSLMRVMGIHGFTLYHLKSHLQQKYRLGKSQCQPQSSDSYIESSSSSSNNAVDNKGDEDREIQSREGSLSRETIDGPTQTAQINHRSSQIAEALQMQMEVQRKLHEQIEVQMHLQLRIEAQGKYLQSVLKKAQETLSGYGSSTMNIELAKAELSQLFSMFSCTSSSFSELTELGTLELNEAALQKQMCSVESSLTSSENEPCNSDLTIFRGGGKKRKREPMLDLNMKYQNDSDLGPRAIDLNCHETEHLMQ